MTTYAPPPRSPTRIESLKVRNFRALRDVEFKDLTPLTVLLGPNGSGKSTLIDVFAFLSECFGSGLRRAWDKRGRAKELKSRGGDGPVTIEFKYREPSYPLISYHLSVDERAGVPVVLEEWLRWKRGSHGQPFKFLDYHEGRGQAVSGDRPDEQGPRVEAPLQSADLLAVNALGQFADHPRVAALRDFITGWLVWQQSAGSAHGQREAGPAERLVKTGDNLANAIKYLDLLRDPAPPTFIGIQEPETSLHPRLHPELAEECHAATVRTQLLVTTHAPYFLDALWPAEVRVLWRDEQGYTRAERAADLRGVKEFVAHGALLGQLWMEGQFGVGDPLVNQGAPSRPPRRAGPPSVTAAGRRAFAPSTAP